MTNKVAIVALLVLLPFGASSQNLEVSPDQLFGTVGRCAVEVEYLRKALAEAKVKIAELTKAPPKGDADGK